MKVLCKLRRGEIAQRFQQPMMVEPPAPVERRALDIVEAAPWAAAMNGLGLEQTDHGFREGMVVGVAAAANRSLDAGFREPLGVADR